MYFASCHEEMGHIGGASPGSWPLWWGVAIERAQEEMVKAQRQGSFDRSRKFGWKICVEARDRVSLDLLGVLHYLLWSILVLVLTHCLIKFHSGKNFWRRGLEQVWADKRKLSDSDVLRFQWPSVGKGWEDGILTFTRAMAQPKPISDSQLVEQTLKAANCTVSVIIASQDKVIQSESIRKFLEPFADKLEITEMEGLGHDPFEEDPESFLNVVEKVCENGKEKILGAS